MFEKPLSMLSVKCVGHCICTIVDTQSVLGNTTDIDNLLGEYVRTILVYKFDANMWVEFSEKMSTQ